MWRKFFSVKINELVIMKLSLTVYLKIISIEKFGGWKLSVDNDLDSLILKFYSSLVEIFG